MTATLTSPRRLRLRKTISAVALTFAALLGGAWLAAAFSIADAPHSEGQPGAAAVSVPPGLAYPKQGPDQCGAYSLALALHLRDGGPLDPAALVARVSHEVPGSRALSGTLPSNIAAELARRGFRDQAFTAGRLPKEQRLSALKQALSEGHPTLVLIESERGIQHYIVALGYRQGSIDIYDPNFEADVARPGFTKDQNQNRPGNRSLSEEAFYEAWSKGGTLGLYRWWFLPVRRM